MSDLIARLRSKTPNMLEGHEAMELAADEITSLRAENEALHSRLIEYGGAIAILEASEDGLKADLAAAREREAGAYLAAVAVQDQKISYWEAETESRTGHRADMASARLAGHLSARTSLRDLTPADATAALEDRIQRERAEERAKVIEEVKAVCNAVVAEREAQIADQRYDFTMKERFRAGVLQTKFVSERIDALHTAESRKAGAE